MFTVNSSSEASQNSKSYWAIIEVTCLQVLWFTSRPRKLQHTEGGSTTFFRNIFSNHASDLLLLFRTKFFKCPALKCNPANKSTFGSLSQIDTSKVRLWEEVTESRQTNYPVAWEHHRAVQARACHELLLLNVCFVGFHLTFMSTPSPATFRKTCSDVPSSRWRMNWAPAEAMLKGRQVRRQCDQRQKYTTTECACSKNNRQCYRTHVQAWTNGGESQFLMVCLKYLRNDSALSKSK